MSASDFKSALKQVLSGASRWLLWEGDSLKLLKQIPENSVDSIVTDPPAGIGFMGANRWDSFRMTGGGERENFMAFIKLAMSYALQALKPGGHALVWALPRTSHWTAMALEDCGFEIRNTITHIFYGAMATSYDFAADLPPELAQTYAGYGTAIKPASENWILCRKPVSGTIAENILKYGTGGLNIDGCRIATDEKISRKLGKTTESSSGWKSTNRSEVAGKDGGRFPSNVIFSHSADCRVVAGDPICVPGCPVTYLNAASGADDIAGPSRYFPCFRPIKKASKSEKDRACAGLYWRKDGKRASGFAAVAKEDWDLLQPSQRAQGNIHSTVKSIELMSWLTRLITPPKGLVLDPFMGSGTSGVAALREGFRFLGIEREPEYAIIAQARVLQAQLFESEDVSLFAQAGIEVGRERDADQLDLLATLVAGDTADIPSEKEPERTPDSSRTG